MASNNSGYARAGAAGLAALILFLGTSAAASGAPPPAGQSSPSPPADETRAAGTAYRLTLKEAGREFLSDAGRIWSSPARIRGRDVVPLIGLAAATAFLIASDESIRDGVRTFTEKHAWVGDAAPVVTQMGGLAGFATAGAFFGAGVIFRDPRAKDAGYLAASAILQCFFVDNLVKGLAGRQRPFVADGEDHWAGPAAFLKRFEKDSHDLYVSFPSGHSAAAFSLATVVALQYRRHGWVPVVAYSLAAGVGLSRMALDRHWASDVAIGAVVGHLVARLVVRNHERRRRIVPALACTARGVALSLSFDLDPAVR